MADTRKDLLLHPEENAEYKRILQLPLVEITAQDWKRFHELNQKVIDALEASLASEVIE